jgi:beta-exotoxin I transport system permease protein
MLGSILLKTLRDRRRSLLWWSVGLVAFSATVVAFWPSIEASAADLQRLFRNLPTALRAFTGGQLDLTSPEGYLDGRLFSFLGPVLFLAFTIGFGSRTVAGEEQAGTLELLLAAPLPRWRIVAEKFGALVLATAALGVLLWASLAVGAGPVGMEIGAGRLAAVTAMLVLVGLTFGALALLVGAMTGKRGFAVGLTGAIAFAAYLVHVYAPVVDALDAVDALSPFYYYDSGEALRSGIEPAHPVILIVMTLLLAGFALAAFDRRDVRV